MSNLLELSEKIPLYKQVVNVESCTIVFLFATKLNEARVKVFLFCIVWLGVHS